MSTASPELLMRDAAATTLVSAIVWSVLTFAQDTRVPQADLSDRHRPGAG